mmetsp:Transcript_15143/g.26804  ORF Transcript_15143/g.26804 Transcript_15143/m.26804 type:complete len:591 (-) Transcript_15143:312-2084(-)
MLTSQQTAGPQQYVPTNSSWLSDSRSQAVAASHINESSEAMSSLLSEFPEDMDELLDEIEAEWDQAFAGLGDECHYPFSELEFGIDFPDFLPPPDGNMLGDTRVSGNSSNIFLNWSAGIDKVDTSMRVELPSVVCGGEQNMPEFPLLWPAAPAAVEACELGLPSLPLIAVSESGSYQGNPVEAIDVVSDFSLVGKGKEKRIRCIDDDSCGERDSCSKSSRTPTSNIGNNKRVRRSFMSELSFLDDFDITEVIGDGPLLSPAVGPSAPATPEKNNDIVSIRHTHANLVEQLPSPAIEAEGDNVAMRTPTRKPRKKKISLNVGAKAAVSINSTSQYRGVSRHKLTQRYEASLWLRRRQVYLGGYNSEEDAARAYDVAALLFKGRTSPTNFPVECYEDQLTQLDGESKEVVIAHLRRNSSAFSRGKSRHRGVSGHDSRWEARIGGFNGRKNVSFGVYNSEEDAARQYDRALIIEKGKEAKTNFPLTDYTREVQEYEAFLLSRFGTMNVAAIPGEGRVLAESCLLPFQPAEACKDELLAYMIFNLADCAAISNSQPSAECGGGGSNSGSPRKSSTASKAAVIYAHQLQRAIRNL